MDLGYYTCQAENSAGLVNVSVTLKILRREASSAPPIPEGQSTGYAAAIAAGALLGTLLALGCLFFGIILYARRIKSRGKGNLKGNLPAVPGSTAPQPTSILKNSQHKNVPPPATSSYQQQHHQQQHQQDGGGLVVRMDSPPAVLESSELAEMAYLRPRKYLIEPDLINEVPTFYPAARPSCLDQDGYPLNFGLPKIPLHQRQHLQQQPQHHHQHLISGTLPSRFRQRSAAQPAQRHSRAAEFLARSATRMAYDCPFEPPPPGAMPLEVLPVPPFIPSPPPAYRGEPQGGTSPAVVVVPGAVVVPPRAESLESIEHPESPDEGYVGDAMDV